MTRQLELESTEQHAILRPVLMTVMMTVESPKRADDNFHYIGKLHTSALSNSQQRLQVIT